MILPFILTTAVSAPALAGPIVQASSPAPIIPLPVSMSFAAGSCPLVSARVSIQAPNPKAPYATELRDYLASHRKGTGSSGRLPIKFELTSAAKDLGPEGYEIVVGKTSVNVRASKEAGLLYATQTLKQMAMGSKDGSVPCVTVKDQPRFEWRGMLLDVSRHFFTVPEIKKVLDYLKELKLNVFHWHLIDDGGWRIEIKKYPKLTQLGSYRLQRPNEVWNYNNIEFLPANSSQPKYGGFYTQEQIKDVLRYAAERNITVVPEIEMPGHCLPAMVAQPEVSCSIEKGNGRPYRALAYCAGKEATFKFLEDVLDEVIALFPSKLIHIGGDEVDKYYWSKCPDCQARKKSENLKDEHELQSYFIKRIEKYLNSKGRDLMGWDEILEGGLAPNAQVMSWRGEAGGIAAANSNHRVAMSPTSHCYFDFSYESIPTSKAYAYEPIPAELKPDKAKFVRGGQANVWTEWIPTLSKAEEMIFPRICAMAETLWTPKSKKNFDNFSGRLQAYLPRLAEQGANMHIDAPEADANLVIFTDKVTLAFRKSAVPGIVLRVQKNGKPTAQSPVYASPIVTTEPATFSAQSFMNGKAVGPVTTVSAQRYSAPANSPLGIQYDVYLPKAAAFTSVPNFASLTPTSSGTVNAIGLQNLSNAKSYALRLQTTIKITKAGVYTFSTTSDDGSNLWIGDKLVVMNDYSQGMTERFGKAVLSPGIYVVTIGYFQEGGAAGLKASVEGPGLAKGDLTRLLP